MLSISKSYHCIKSSLCCLMVFLCSHSYGQVDLLLQAQDFANTNQIDKAIPLLEKVILHDDTKNDPDAWHIRAFCYLKSYRMSNANMTIKINLLDTAVTSSIKSIVLDKKNDFRENNLAFIKNSAAGYYTLCNKLLTDSSNYTKSEACYLKYKKYHAILNPDFDFKQKDIEYYSYAGSFFANMYSNNNFNQKYVDNAKVALQKVLEIDPKNISANVNLGVLYYNQGAMLMRMMDYDADLSQLDVIQENAKKLFKQSLPFMIKVYELDPDNKKVLESLQGSYSALMDEEKANEFQRKKEALKQK